MLKRILSLVIALIATTCMFAQSKKDLRIIYIDHEVTTPVNDLCAQLKTARNDALEDEGTSLIIYLSTGLQETNYGIMSFTNVERGNENENDDAFNSVIAALQGSNYHNVNPKRDVINYINLFDKYRFIDDDNQKNVRRITLDFYVGSNFWKLGYNHKIIAHLYSALNLENIPSAELDINLRVPKGVDLGEKEGKLFGEMNIQNINSKKNIKRTSY